MRYDFNDFTWFFDSELNERHPRLLYCSFILRVRNRQKDNERRQRSLEWKYRMRFESAVNVVKEDAS